MTNKPIRRVYQQPAYLRLLWLWRAAGKYCEDDI